MADTTDETTVQTANQLEAVLADLADVMRRVGPRQAHDRTPCAEYDVAALRDHIVGWLTNFAAGASDPEGRAPRESNDGYHAPDDADKAADAVREASKQLVTALRGGAAERDFRLGQSSVPGKMGFRMILLEYQVHGWDLARATGQQWSPPEEAAMASFDFAPAMLGDGPRGGAFAEPVAVPADAPVLDRLLGFVGRDPNWSA